MPVPDETVAPRVLLRDAAYGQLLAAIVDGTLVPGERLRDDDLVSWLGVSRTPIREAIARLEEDGLVETAPNRFTQVATVSPADAADTYPVAAALHALAGELAAAREGGLDLAAAGQLSDRFDWAVWRSDVAEAVAADDALHALVLDAAGNAHLRRLVARVMPRVRRMEWRTWAQVDRRTIAASHQRLLAAMAGRDQLAATQAARDEWLEVGRLVERALWSG